MRIGAPEPNNVDCSSVSSIEPFDAHTEVSGTRLVLLTFFPWKNDERRQTALYDS